MSRFYESLAESLQEQYITEAWAESMPQWLKDAMSYSATYHARRNSTSPQSPKYAKFGYQRDHQVPRNDPEYNRTGWEGTTLYGAFKAHGIDPAECEYIECEPPTNPRDPIFKDGSIPIWGFDLKRYDPDEDGIQVYARGMNDLEKIAWSNPLILNARSEFPFKSVAVKKLSEECDHFCYIPKESLEKLPIKDFNQIHKDRAERQEIPTQLRRGTPGADEPAYLYTPDKRFGYLQRDKSGYVVVPSADKYARILKRSKARKYAEVLEEYHDELVTAWDEIMAAINGIGMEGDEYALRSATDGLREVRTYVNRYKRFLRDIDNYAAEYGLETEEFYDRMVSLVDDLREDKSSFERHLEYSSAPRAATLDF